MRKLVPLGVVAAALVMAAAAYAATDSVNYSVTLHQSGKASKKKPAPVTYTTTITIRATPAGTQPDGSSTSDLFAPKQLRLNASKFPSPCKQSDIDGKSSIPAKCSKALIGSGTATASAGTPGTPSVGSESFNVAVYNASHGKAVLFVLNSTPGAAVPIHNRVIVGTIKRASGPYGYVLHISVPANLQKVGTLQSTITDVTLTVGKTVKVKGKRTPYAELTSCPKSHKVPSRDVVHFNNGTSVTANTTATCK